MQATFEPFSQNTDYDMPSAKLVRNRQSRPNKKQSLDEKICSKMIEMENTISSLQSCWEISDVCNKVIYLNKFIAANPLSRKASIKTQIHLSALIAMNNLMTCFLLKTKNGQQYQPLICKKQTVSIAGHSVADKKINHYFLELIQIEKAFSNASIDSEREMQLLTIAEDVCKEIDEFVEAAVPKNAFEGKEIKILSSLNTLSKAFLQTLKGGEINAWIANDARNADETDEDIKTEEEAITDESTEKGDVIDSEDDIEEGLVPWSTFNFAPEQAKCLLIMSVACLSAVVAIIAGDNFRRNFFHLQ